MARVKRERKPRARRATKAAENDFMGDEPKVAEERIDYMKALNWYNYFCEVKSARKWLDEYVKRNKLSLRNTKEINITMCAIARMMNNGVKLPAEAKVYLHNKINERREQPKSLRVKTARIDTTKVNIADFEDLLDEFYRGEYKFFEPKVYETLTTLEAKPSEAKAIIEYYTPLLDELIELSKETKARIGLRKYNDYVKFVASMIADAKTFASNKRAAKPRKPRRKRTVDPAKAASKVKYLPELTELQLVSIPPEKIIGAEEVWLYNAKYRKLQQYVALEGQQLGIKGTTILNYSEASVSKKLRKPDVTLKEFMAGTKANKRRVFKAIKSATRPVNGRVNEHTMILIAT